MFGNMQASYHDGTKLTQAAPAAYAAFGRSDSTDTLSSALRTQHTSERTPEAHSSSHDLSLSLPAVQLSPTERPQVALRDDPEFQDWLAREDMTGRHEAGNGSDLYTSSKLTKNAATGSFNDSYTSQCHQSCVHATAEQVDDSVSSEQGVPEQRVQEVPGMGFLEQGGPKHGVPGVTLLEEGGPEQESALRLAGNDLVTDMQYGQHRLYQVAPVSVARSRIAKRKAGLWTELHNAKKVSMARVDYLISWACNASSQLPQRCCMVQQRLVCSSEGAGMCTERNRCIEELAQSMP